MQRGRLRGFGLVVAVAGVAGCTHSATDMPSREGRAGVAVPSYAPPAGTPDFCGLLAGTTSLTAVPAALGMLAADADVVEARLTLSAAIDELQGVLDHVPPRGGNLAVGTSLEQLITALLRARDRRLTDDLRTSISTGLDDVGRQAQTACGFPT